MTTLKEIRKSVSEMSFDELSSHIRTLREDRKALRPVSHSQKIKTVGKVRNEIAKALKKLSPEERKKYLESLGG